MWNNGQQQAAWWPTYSYSQVPALPTQDATFDESQQWAIKAAMWAQQKKMQEQFQQQVQIYHEQLQQQVPKTDLPPLPPETSLLKPPPPPDVESEQPPLPPFDGEHAFHGVNEPVKPSENLGTHQPPPPIHKGSLVDNIEHFRVHDNRENHTDTHGIDGKQGFIDTREPRRDFKKGHWRPFGTGVGSDELHQEGSVFGRQDYDDRVVHQHHEFSHNQSNRSDHEMHHEPAVYRDREPYIDNYKHNHHDDYQFDNVEIRHHRLLPPGLDPNVMVPPPILDQPQNLDYYGSQSRVPVFAFPQGGELQPPEPFPPSTEEVMALSGMEMARKKGLPMWLREALEKHEKEKQKKIAKGRGVDDKGKSKLSSISGYQHGASSDDDSASGDNIDEKNIEVNKQDQLNRKELNSSPSTGRQPSDASSEESGNESEQEDEAEKMLRVKKMVTEILLSVTNAEIKSITFEVYNEAKRTVLNTANLLRSSGGLDALRNAMGSYASSSDEDEKKRQDETILDRRDSSVPLDVGAKSSIAGTSKDNGKSTKTKLKHRSETKRRKSSDSSDSSSNSDTESSDSSTSSQSDTANVSVSTESSKGHRNKKSKGYSKRRRDRSLSASTSDVSLKKKKAKKRQRSLSPHERKSKTSRSPLGKKHRRKDSPRHSKDEKRQGKHESTNDEKSDTKQNRRDKKHKEKTPEKKHKRKDDEKKSKVSSRRKHKRKSEESEESSDNERKGSSAKRKTSKQRNRSRSRSRTPRHRKSEHRR